MAGLGDPQEPLLQANTNVAMVLKTGDAITCDLDAPPDRVVPHTVRYASVEKANRDGRQVVKLHRTRRDAFQLGTEGGESYESGRDRRLDHMDVALGRLKYVKQDMSAVPSPLVDIESSWQFVALECACALGGVLPGVGVILSAVIAIKYSRSIFALAASPADSPTLKNISRGITLGNFFYVFWNPILLAMKYRDHFHDIETAVQNATIFQNATNVTGTEEALKVAVGQVQFMSIKNMIFVSSFLIVTILKVRSIYVFADVACYKAEAEHGLSDAQMVRLEGLKQLFSNLYEPGDPPTSLNHHSFMEQIPLGTWIPVWFSFFVMLGGFLAMLYNLTVDKSWYSITDSSVFSSILGIGITANNWLILLRFLTSARAKMQKNAKQLLLFSALVKNQDFGRWSASNRNALRSYLEAALKVFLPSISPNELTKELGTLNLQELVGLVLQASTTFSKWRPERLHALRGLLKQELDARLSQMSNADQERFTQSTLESQELNLATLAKIILHHSEEDHMFASAIPHDQKKIHDIGFDLTDINDARNWWALRTYTRIDFMDESSVMDYCCVVTLLLIGFTLLLGLIEFSVHKDTWSSMMSAESAFSAIMHIIPMGGLAVIVNCVLALAAIFYAIIQECISINQVLDNDANVLLAVAAEVQLKGTSEHPRSTESSTVTLLNTLVQNIKEVDQRQTLFGFPITANLRNALFASVGTFMVNYLWNLLGPLLQFLDVHKAAAVMEKYFAEG